MGEPVYTERADGFVSFPVLEEVDECWRVLSAHFQEFVRVEPGNPFVFAKSLPGAVCVRVDLQVVAVRHAAVAEISEVDGGIWDTPGGDLRLLAQRRL